MTFYKTLSIYAYVYTYKKYLVIRSCVEQWGGGGLWGWEPHCYSGRFIVIINTGKKKETYLHVFWKLENTI